MSMTVTPLEWKNDQLVLIDQRILPLEENYLTYDNIQGVHEAIKTMVVRGAPLIGFSALWGMVLELKNDPNITIEKFEKSGSFLKTARPTAVNLAFEVDRSVDMSREYLKEKGTLEGFKNQLEAFAHQQFEQLHKDNQAMAKLAEKELQAVVGDRKLNLMTLCNTGALACGPMGTALGVISHMNNVGKINKVYASETRPYLQGGRLTAFELYKEGIEHYIVVEGAASYLLKNKLVDAIFIGADRIVKNGDTANKVGSSSLAIIAKEYGVPFYVVAPTSSFDLFSETGSEIEIELRPEEEILNAGTYRIAPHGSRALNPSFDVTDHAHITGIFCENGLIRPSERGQLENVVRG